MRINVLMTICIAVVLIACVSHEGTYSPDCAAFEGSNIRLSDGQFVWEKFTDAIQVDGDGNVVNQFPGYPLSGTYRIAGETVHMQAESGAAIAPMYLYRDRDRQYLLTAEQWQAQEATGKYSGCALLLT